MIIRAACSRSFFRSAPVVAVIVLVAAPACVCAGFSATVNFDKYTSASDNDYINNFSDNTQLPNTGPAYVQNTAGGVTGGSLTAAPGTPDYLATADYLHPLAFSTQGDEITASLFLFYDNPLPITARSFRLGLVNDPHALFESVNYPSVYIYGLYSDGSSTMQVTDVSANGGTFTTGGGSVGVQDGHWYKLTASFTNAGAGKILYADNIADYGTSGGAFQSTLGSWTETIGNSAIANSPSVYVGLSALQNGGIQRVDNFQIAAVPEPSTIALAISGLLCWVFAYRRRTR